MSKYYILTYGCQMNKSDSEKYAGIFESLGYQSAESIEDADVILLNTCSVREKAEEKVIGKLGELKRIKSKKPNVFIGIAGCMAQRVGKEFLNQFPYIDFILGSYNFSKLPLVLKNLYLERKPQVIVEEDPIPEDIPWYIVKRESSFQAWIPIIYGCNNFCTYCIVPYLRGREKSRPKESIIEEVKYLAQKGVVEIILLGQNVDSYGKDLGNVDLADLLEELNKIEEIKRIRFLTSHPRDVSLKLINTVARLEKVCPHWHLPLQAGSNRVLQRMGRGYTYEEYYELINLIRRTIPHASFSTDIIVGFPGEEEEDFEKTRKALEEIKFDTVNLAIYSKRPGTPAEKFEDPVPYEKKKEWFNELENLQRKIVLEKNEKLVGKEEVILAENVNPKNPEELSGRTQNYRLVFFKGNKEKIGKFFLVRITKAGLWSLRGEIIKELS
ncbi:MAG: tRNA (N6-isopentenyl adenosine(37)-C2)-methylthiotransferase MiaB [Dictyoglomaceae bacterium]